MAQQISVTLTDDLDGSEADETVRFGLDDQFYEIDLSAEHAKELRDGIFGKYITHARRTAPSPRSARRRRQVRAASASAADAGYPVDNDSIRQWGKDHGWDVRDRGRVPAGLRAAYTEAMEKKTAGAG